jgi:hypothetical protein
MVWIGIGPGAEAVCPKECELGPACPKCGSRNTEEFTIPGTTSWSYFTPVHVTPDRDGWHCWGCGEVWE